MQEEVLGEIEEGFQEEVVAEFDKVDNLWNSTNVTS